jgi:hypothetical protein
MFISLLEVHIRDSSQRICDLFHTAGNVSDCHVVHRDLAGQ